MDVTKRFPTDYREGLYLSSLTATSETSQQGEQIYGVEPHNRQRPDDADTRDYGKQQHRQAVSN
jgi:hypothetical protein